MPLPQNVLLVKGGESNADKLRSDAFLQQAMDTCGDAVYRLALCRLNSPRRRRGRLSSLSPAAADDTDFRDTEHLKAWLLRVTLSRCADLRRSAWIQAHRTDGSCRGCCHSGTEKQGELWQAVHALPDDQRIAVWLHYVEGYRTEEIAEMVGCRPATVRTRYASRKKAIKAGFGEDLR